MVRRIYQLVSAGWRSLTRGSQLDAEMDDEMRFHIESEAERLQREQHLDPIEARRRAFVAFGGVEKWKETERDARGTQWIDAIVMDCRIGVRMLIKHRSLTVIGAFAMTITIAIGATVFEGISEAISPALPVPDGDRVVSIEYATDVSTLAEKPDLHDLADWRAGLETVRSLGAYRNAQYNLAISGSYPEPVRIAEMTASGFTLMRTPPLLGRTLVQDDERDGAARVVVIGFAEWQRRFNADPEIVGKEITLNAQPFTVVGVMPAGFAFPINHQFWIALQVNPSRDERRKGPQVSVFGVLADGATRESVEAQLAALHTHLVDEDKATFGRLRPMVLPYTHESVELDQLEDIWLLRVVQFLIGSLLVIVAINLSILFYARTVTRLGEIAVRTALGASRIRILAQLFLEAFVLSVSSAGVGLLISRLVLGWLKAVVGSTENVPFWITFELSSSTVLYAVVLAAIAAFIVGVIPGFKTTGVRLDTHLRALTGSTGLRLGALWTTLIVAQVAAAVAILPIALYLVSEMVRTEASGAGFADDQIVIAKVDHGRNAEVMRRVAAEAGVAAVTFSWFVPGYAGDRVVEFEDPATRDREGRQRVTANNVGINLFEVYEARLLKGREFAAADRGTGTVIVNQSFEREFFPDGNVLGQRFSFVRGRLASDREEEQRSFEIVGVVSDFPAFRVPQAPGVSTIYLPAASEELSTAIVSIRYHGVPPANVAGRLRQIGEQVDPSAPMRDVQVLSDFYEKNRALWKGVSSALAAITLCVLLLSAAGIYALMSFTVAQRTREIGIRTALGGDQRRILAGVFGRVMMQLSIGVVIGSLLATVTILATSLSAIEAMLLVLTVGAMLAVVGLIAAIGPARRSLRIPTTEALRVE